MDGQNKWPPSLPAFRETVMGYFDACTDLSRSDGADKSGFASGWDEI